MGEIINIREEVETFIQEFLSGYADDLDVRFAIWPETPSIGGFGFLLTSGYFEASFPYYPEAEGIKLSAKPTGGMWPPAQDKLREMVQDAILSIRKKLVSILHESGQLQSCGGWVYELGVEMGLLHDKRYGDVNDPSHALEEEDQPEPGSSAPTPGQPG
jgi:hypothetical protein